LFVHEEFQPAAEAKTGKRTGYRAAVLMVLATAPLLTAFAARIFLRIGSRTLDPVLPLFVQSLLPAGAAVGTTTGIISAASALGAAVGAPLIGGWSDRLGHRRLLIRCAFATGIFYLAQAFVGDPRWLIGLQLVNGFAIGGTLSTLTALLARLTPEGHAGVVFGLDASAMAACNAIGPIIGAAVAAPLGLRAPFFVAALMFGIGACLVYLWMGEGRHAPLAKTIA